MTECDTVTVALTATDPETAIATGHSVARQRVNDKPQAISRARAVLERIPPDGRPVTAELMLLERTWRASGQRLRNLRAAL
ncbi:MAG: hypothetical protein AB1486_10765 [Planctomycetota bacterium]